MKQNNKIIIAVVILLAVIAGAYLLTQNNSLGNSGSNNITDMVGRNVTVPAKVDKIICTGPPATNLVYMLAPEKLVGFNYKINPEEKKFIPKKYQELPAVGGWFGKQDGNYEQMLSYKPDIVIESAMMPNKRSNIDKKNQKSPLEERQEKFGSVPVVAINDTSNLTTLNPTIEFTGKLLGAEEKSKKLIEFNTARQKEVRDVVSKIPEDEKVTVYYAEGPNGLKTDPSGSSHAQLIDFCGGKNIADVQMKPGMGQTDVSMEQVLKWNPEVIITTDPNFYKNVVYNDSNWKNVEAVKNKRVYLSPQSPLKWFDRPPGPNIIIGIPWTAKILYPDKFKDLDVKGYAKEFYSEFYSYDLTDEEIDNILKESGM